MKTKEDNGKKNFTKLTRIGISLIVLVITIIVILILATAVILTINNNNPVSEANDSRYESDRTNMQAIFTNVVAKVMTYNKGTVSVTAGKINTVTSGVRQTIGEIRYTVTDAQDINNSTGKIVFDKGTNTDTVFYTGKQLPIYAAGETKWYVDEEGIILLEVAKTTYGSGEKPLDPGLYNEEDEMIVSWEELVNDYGIDVETDYVSIDEIEEFLSSETLPEVIQSGNYPAAKLLANTDFSKCTKLVIGNDITKIGSGAFVFFPTLEEIIIPNGVVSIGDATFAMCSKLKKIEISNTLTSIGYLAFGKCLSLESIELPNSLRIIDEEAFWGCTGLKNIAIPDTVTSIGREAFDNCSSLTSVIIGNSVESIGNSAFAGCSSLTSIVIPNSVTSIGYSAFDGCTNLTIIYYKGIAVGAPWGADNATVITEF